MNHTVWKNVGGVLAGVLAAGTLTVAALGDPSSVVNGTAFVLVDGDTLALGHERIRLEGPDTPESYKPRCDAELVVALQAKQKLRELLGDNEIVIERHGVDKYGRTLARLYVGDSDTEIGEQLIASGLAVRWQPGRAAWLERARHWCPGYTED